MTETPLPPRPAQGGILSFDWGVRRLATMVVLSPDGEQLVQPSGFRRDDRQAELFAFPYRPAQIQALTGCQRKTRGVSPLQIEIDACWRKYAARNKAAAHLASLGDCFGGGHVWLFDHRRGVAQDAQSSQRPNR